MEIIVKAAELLIPFLLGLAVNSAKHTSQQVDQLISDVRNIEQMAVNYWKMERNKDAEALEILLKSKIASLSRNVRDLHADSILFSMKDLTSIRVFRQSITSSTFEVNGRPPDLSRIADISNASENLIRTLRRSLKWI